MSDGQNAQQQVDEQHERQLVVAYRNLMSQPWGRLIVRDLFVQAGLHLEPYRPGDDHGTHYAIGVGYVGRYLDRRVRTHCFDDFQQMERESRE